MVRAKFKVDKIERTLYGNEEMQTIVLSPVYGGGNASEENKQFWKWTPTGQILLGTINKDAAEQFSLGQEFYIDFTKA